MISFRIRRYGKFDWVSVDLSSNEEDEDAEDLAQQLAHSVLQTFEYADDLHIQQMNDEGEWEDVE